MSVQVRPGITLMTKAHTTTHHEESVSMDFSVISKLSAETCFEWQTHCSHGSRSRSRTFPTNPNSTSHQCILKTCVLSLEFIFRSRWRKMSFHIYLVPRDFQVPLSGTKSIKSVMPSASRTLNDPPIIICCKNWENVGLSPLAITQPCSWETLRCHTASKHQREGWVSSFPFTFNFTLSFNLWNRVRPKKFRVKVFCMSNLRKIHNKSFVQWFESLSSKRLDVYSSIDPGSKTNNMS